MVGFAPARTRSPAIGLRYRRRYRQQPVREPFDQTFVAPQDAQGDGEVGVRLGRQGFRVGRGRLVHALVRDAVAGHELLADRPELGGVPLVRRAVAGRVHFAVATAFAGPEPGDARDRGLVGPTRGVQHGPGDGPPLHAVLGAGHAPAIGFEPVDRSAVDHGRSGPFVDAEVVPVDQEDQVGEAQPPGRVLRLVSRARRQTALAFEDEDFDLVGAGQLESQRLAGRERHAVAGRPGVGLEEERPAGHLGVAGQPAAVPQPEQMLPGEGEPAVFGEAEARIAGPLGPGPQPFVQDGERGVDQWHGVAGGEDESVAEPKPRPPDVPAHRPGQEQRQEHVDLGPRTARVAALAVVEGEVDALVDEVLEDLVAFEVRFGGGVQAIGLGAGGKLLGRHRRAPAPAAAAASGSTTVRVRRTASAIFSRELA